MPGWVIVPELFGAKGASAPPRVATEPHGHKKRYAFSIPCIYIYMVAVAYISSTKVTERVFFDVAIANEPIGRIVLVSTPP